MIRQVIQRSLSAPRPLYADRAAKHAEAAEKLRKTQTAKRKEQREKRVAKKGAASNPTNKSLLETRQDSDDLEQSSRLGKRPRREEDNGDADRTMALTG